MMIDAIWPILAVSFPKNEIRNYERQKELFKKPNYFCICFTTSNKIIQSTHFTNEDQIKGVLCYWTLDDLIFIEHLAVDPAYRGEGIGQKLLKHIQHFATQIVLEVEVQTKDDPYTIRRVQFYERLGFCLNDLPYFQPPLNPGDDCTPLNLMSYPTPLGHTFKEVQNKLYTEVYHYVALD